MTDERWIEGICDFEPGVYFKEEVLGSESDVSVGGVAGVIALPRLPPDRVWLQPIPQLLGPRFESSNIERAIVDSERVWGTPCHGFHCSVYGALLRFPVPAEQDRTKARDVGEQVHVAFDAWRHRLMRWLMALTGQDLDASEPQPWHGVQRSPLDLFGLDAANKLFRAQTSPLVVHGVTPTLPAAASQWHCALANASNDEDLPLQHELLNLARSALARGRNRRAVIEAATAAEIALTEGINSRLAKLQDTDVVEAVNRRYRNLEGKIELCGRLRLALPTDAKRDLVDPRNRAVHGGHEPSGPVAKDAVAIARTIVRQHTPLAPAAE